MPLKRSIGQEKKQKKKKWGRDIWTGHPQYGKLPIMGESWTKLRNANIFRDLFSSRPFIPSVLFVHKYNYHLLLPPTLTPSWEHVRACKCMYKEENESANYSSVYAREVPVNLKLNVSCTAATPPQRDNQDKFLLCFSIWRIYSLCQMQCNLTLFHFCTLRVPFLKLKMNKNLWGISWLSKLTSI